MIKKLKTLDNKKVRKLLVLSLLINAFCFSLMAGHYAMHEYKVKQRKHYKYHLVDKQQIKSHREEIRLAKIQLKQALLEQPYNKAKVQLAFNNLDSKIDSARNIMNNAIIDKAANLSPQERLELLPPNLKRHKKHKVM